LQIAQTHGGRRNRRTGGETARVRDHERERVYLDARRHGIVLLPALLRAFGIAAAGGFLFATPFPLPLAGAVLVAGAAVLALRAVWKWEQTHVVVTDEKLALVRGTLRRRTAAVRLDRVGTVEIDQTMLGRLFGYGTLTAGPLAITYVPQPRNVYGLVESLSP
jgi:membrane protein YdbS with pleckstrin-like domain